MATENKCPHCGKPVSTTALGGICPECMLKAGLADTGEVGPDGTVVKSPPPAVPQVEDLAPHFPQLEILECLGRGGMGAVYKARQPKLDRFVALKILSRKRENGQPDAEFTQRFEREARALARLSHPDIVAVYDFGEAGGFHYLLMEFVDGLTLRQLLQTRKLAPEEALAIVPKICGALQFAHERGIVHRDIKPENILLDKQGQLKIADFGIAKIVTPLTPSLSPSDGERVAGRPGEGNLTQNQVIGTPHYMAPEQVEKPATVDHRADIYSLGVVFYEMLTGELPLGKFQSPSKKVQVDVRLDEVVLHALEKEPDRRYQHASEVKTDVESIAANAPVTREATGEAASPPMPNRWEAALIGIGLTVFIALLVAIPTVSPLFRPVLTVLTVIGLSICFLTLAGWWPAPSFLVPDSGFSGRNLPGRRRTKVGQTGGHDHAIMAAAGHSKLVIAARWTARVFGTLLLLFYGIFVLAEGLPPIATQPEGVQLNFVALGLMLAGFAVGWKREGTAALLIASGWTLWQISENSIRWNLFQTPLPVAILYGFCWWATRGRRSGVVATAVLVFALALGLGRVFVPTNIFVRGVVRDAQSGQPVPNAELRLPSRATQSGEKSERPNARSGQDGRFTLYVGWLSDQTPVTISAPGYQTLTTSFGPRPPHRNMLRDFHLQSAGAIPVEAKVPPVVVETSPVSGAVDVDPGLSELRVKFSTPMQDGGWSWVKLDNETFPPTTGNPRFLPDRQSCVLPVKLQPGKLYAVWINYGTATNFQDAAGKAALPYLLIFETRK
jgi:tRNA A-37 threonylcarbamoyl transferase component Bud32